MKLENIKTALENYQNGQFIRVGWQSRIESAKARKMGIEVVKMSEATVRLGIKYGNIHAVQVMRENETGEKKSHTVWFRHLEDFPVIIEHLQDEAKKYLQIFTVNKNSSPKVRYFVNDCEVSREHLEELGYCNPSEFKKNETLTFNVPIENLRFIGNFS